MRWIREAVARERAAVMAHRASLRGAAIAPPSDAPKGTFLHGFFLPFALILATLRDRELRGPYVKVTVVRLLVVAIVTAIGCSSGSRRDTKAESGVVVVHHEIGPSASAAPASSGVHVHIPGVDIDLDDRPGARGEVKVLGQTIPVEDVEAAAPPRPDEDGDAATANTTTTKANAKVRARATTTKEHRAPGWLASGWARVLAFFAIVSGASAVVIALSRRYDDWLGYFVATRLALVKPEDETPKERKIGPDFKWLKKKAKERVREYVSIASGMPVIALLSFVPTVGPVLFQIATFAWAWYWVGVFTAAKNDHSLIDAATAPSMRLVRGLRFVGAAHWSTAPVGFYARVCAWLTRSFNSPAAFFERTPAAFLGLALARLILSLPGLYLLAKPIVPVAAGRLCAEADPADRFRVEVEAVGAGRTAKDPSVLAA